MVPTGLFVPAFGVGGSHYPRALGRGRGGESEQHHPGERQILISAQIASRIFAIRRMANAIASSPMSSARATVSAPGYLSLNDTISRSRIPLVRTSRIFTHCFTSGAYHMS
jgi:hypothetical protein